MILAIDFDGTIVENKYPEIGKERLFAFQSLRMLQEEGHRLILWTYRSGKELSNAIEYCKKNGLEFYAINKNYPEEVYSEKISRKISADIYIDDCNYRGIPDSWTEIYNSIHNKHIQLTTKRNIFSKLFN